MHIVSFHLYNDAVRWDYSPQSSKGHITLGHISCKQQKQCLLMEAKRKVNERNGLMHRIEGKGGEPGFREDGEQR